ncbi:hypothetical protein TL16_g03000 [Triparma laevis f. inornata]|uniref:Uncharacterized protein n=1 Tax=Triparma laevis f. inornata TaxID=1714386 RepID=A0A9W6ZZL2_9STRA|nr:hypothetical protein TL16_g03000 [Triparma laevis f. inornata]
MFPLLRMQKSAWNKVRRRGSARKTWGKNRSGKKSELAKNPVGGGMTLTELGLGWNGLGAEGTKKILGMVNESSGLKSLLLKNCLEGGGEVWVDKKVLRHCDIVTSFPANSIGGFGNPKAEKATGKMGTEGGGEGGDFEGELANVNANGNANANLEVGVMTKEVAEPPSLQKLHRCAEL